MRGHDIQPLNTQDIHIQRRRQSRLHKLEKVQTPLDKDLILFGERFKRVALEDLSPIEDVAGYCA